MRKHAALPGLLTTILLLTALLAGCRPVMPASAPAAEAAATAVATEAPTTEAPTTEAPAAAATAAPTEETTAGATTGATAGADTAPAGTADTGAAATGPSAACTPGEGSIAVLLPDSVSSPRWEQDDRRYFEGALQAAGVAFTIDNAQGDPATQITQAQQALANGAKVLVLTNLDSESGAEIIASAREAGASVIDYDRLTTSGPGADLYVSFDNLAVGSLMGTTLEPLINGLDKERPRVVQLNGAPTDNNATLVRAGYSAVATPYYDLGKWELVGDVAVPNWSKDEARTLFSDLLAGSGEQGIDAVFAANDDLAGAVISVLKTQGRPPILLSGQDATVEALQNILSGWQTMTVYKPIRDEASTAVVAALEMLNCTGTSTLSITDYVNNGEKDIPFLRLAPTAVTKENIKETVIADQFRTWEQLCVGDFEQFCPPADQR